MNPIVHAELSWLAASKLTSRRDRILVTLAGVAPDLDGLSLLAGRDAYAEWHHVVFHGWLGAVVTAGLCAAFATRRGAVALLALVAFHLHLLCDLAGSGDRGMGGEGWPLYYFWPVSRTTWFWDGQWDLASWQNTLIGLAATLACLAAAMPLGRTFVEVFSAAADVKVVATLRARFTKTPAVTTETEP
jgi:inner membrane protein